MVLSDAAGNELDRTTTATVGGVDGQYSFDGLLPGDYQITIDDSTLPDADWSVTTDGTTADPIDVTLAAGDAETDADVGITARSSIGDEVFVDLDGDGVQDAGEPGWVGAPLTLALFDGAGTQIATTTTAPADGTYSFDTVLPGDYTVAVVPSSLPTGYTVTSTDPFPVTLGVDATRLDVDFGINATGTIGDFVWYDIDGDGVQAPGEPGLTGGLVQLVTNAGQPGETVVATTRHPRTPTPNYSFTDVNSGQYTVRYDISALPTGAVPTTPTDIAVNLPLGGVIDTADFGIRGSQSIGDTVFIDVNGDGVQDTGPGSLEVGQGGVTVELRLGGNVVLTTTTAADGSYLFDNLLPGPYEVTVDASTFPSPAYSLTTPDPLLADLQPGANITDADIGINALGTVSGSVFTDADENGTQDTGAGNIEPGLGSVTVSLIDPDTGAVALDTNGDPLTVDTNPDGTYSFVGVPAGDYEVRVDTADLGTLDLVAATPNDAAISLPVGGAVADIDFGANERGSIGDRLWVDANGDGNQDGPITEPDLTSGTPITVELLQNGAVVDTVTTTDGTYLFDDLLAGDYTVRVDTSTLPAGFNLTTPNDVAVPLGVGDDIDTVDFGANSQGVIGDLVVYDANANGVRDPGEVGVDGIDVALTPPGPAVAVQTTTSGGGGYTFTNLNAGTYTVSLSAASLPVGSTISAPTPTGAFTVPLPVGGAIDTADFAITGTNTISGTAWFDTDADAVRDGDEPDTFGGVVVNLLDDAGNVVATTTTAADGTYLFPNLFGGTYSVEFDTTTLPAGTTLTTPASIGSRTVVDGDTITDVDAGVTGTGSIGDTVFVDADADGSQAGPLEIGQVGIVVVLSDDAGNEIARTTSAGDGSYSFDNLLPGDYSVAVDSTSLSPGFVVTTPDPQPVALGPGEDVDTVDIGVNATSALSGSVWLDANNDDVRDVTETLPVPDVTDIEVVLFDDAGNEVDRVNLDANGDYTFSDVPAGTWTIEVDETTLPDDPDSFNLTAANGETVTIGVDDDRTGIDFGVNAIGVIGDTVWVDTDGDGIIDPDETERVAGIVVQLFEQGTTTPALDGSGNPITAITGPDGTFSLNGVLAGDYTVVFDPSSFPPGLAPTTPASVDVTLGVGDENLDVDLGLLGTNSIGDLVYFDSDGDGVQDPDEIGEAGIDVQLLDSTGATIATTTTGADGSYLFENLPAGDYQVVVPAASLPTGYSVTTDGSDASPFAVTVADGDVVDTVDIGVTAPGSISGVLFLDVDTDGTRDPAELVGPVSGVEVELVDGAGNVVAAVTIAADGTYSFDDVPPGDYTVRVVEASIPPGYGLTTSTIDVTVEPAGEVTDVDHGVAGTGRVGDLVFVDGDGDGAQDPGEGGLGGVRLILSDSAGNQLAEIITGPNGEYSFDGLIPGDYVVTLDVTSLGDGLEVTGPTSFTVTIDGASPVILTLDFGVSEIVTPPTTTPPGGDIPATGAESTLLLQWAVFLSLLGIALFLVARRRETRSSRVH